MTPPLFYDATGKRRRWSMSARKFPQAAARRAAFHPPPDHVFGRLSAIAGAFSGLRVGSGKLELNGRVNAAQSLKGA